MFSMQPRRILQMTITLAALSALGACGGGSDSPSTPAADPVPPVQPPTGNPPPTDPTPPTDITVTLSDTLTDLNAAIAASAQNWPAWTGTGQAVDGVGCAQAVNYHIHTLLSIYRNGTRLAMPDNIGRSGCTYELHTHDASGVVHIETDVRKKFMLSQYFSLWRQPFTSTNVAGLTGPFRYYLVENGKLTRYTGDPMALELTAYREIVILAGPNPPTVLPKYKWTPGL